MSFLGKMIKAGIDTVSIPIAIVKDVATLGGVLEDEPRPYTLKKLREIGKDIEEAKDEL